MKKRSLDGRAHLRGTWRRWVKKIMAATCSGKEIAGLKSTMMMTKSWNRVWATSRVENWGHVRNLASLTWACRLLLVIYENLGSHSRRVLRHFACRSREIWTVPSLNRASTSTQVKNQVRNKPCSSSMVTVVTSGLRTMRSAKSWLGGCRVMVNCGGCVYKALRAFNELWKDCLQMHFQLRGLVTQYDIKLYRGQYLHIIYKKLHSDD